MPAAGAGPRIAAMRIAVIGDIHANLPALRAVIDDVARIGADAIYCVGDVVGRGPQEFFAVHGGHRSSASTFLRPGPCLHRRPGSTV